MDKLKIKFKKLDSRAVIPTYAHNGDVCMDLTAIDVEYNEENDMYIYHTGLAFASDFNVGQFILLRSSNCKKDCYLCNGIGTVDCAIYRGEVQFRMKLRDSIQSMAACKWIKGFNPLFTIRTTYDDVLNDMINRAKNLEFAPYKVGDMVGQMVCFNYPTIELEEVEELNETERGDGAFGSTGE